jgi:formimidoylglutamate deiminase
MTTLVPELCLDAAGVHRDLAVVLDVEGGTVDAVIGAAHAPADALRLPGLALAPGFVNCHSHAFQRDLRGRVERVSPERPDDDFWTWREAMYAAAHALDPTSMHDVARRCFRQMRRAGYTVCGEFHYVHHQPDGTPYDEPNPLAEAVCTAAEAEGLRICLLLAAYERAGAGLPPTPAQRRFCDPTVDAYLDRLDALAAWAHERPLVTVGAAPHSVRAVSADWLQAIAAYCTERHLPLHVHADEQPREIEECVAEYGVRPVQLLARTGALGPLTTIVHGTHCDADEIAVLAEHGATVCACPTTEANLGDGYVPSAAFLAAGVPMTVGTDSNTRIDPFEELRELEACARRTALRRNVLVRPGDPGPAAVVLDAGWANGWRSLHLPSGGIDAGAPADLVALDLDHDEIAGVADDDLPAAIVFAGSASLVRRSWVAARESGT